MLRLNIGLAWGEFVVSSDILWRVLNWEDPPGKTQDTLRGLYISAGLGMPQDPRGSAGKDKLPSWTVWPRCRLAKKMCTDSLFKQNLKCIYSDINVLTPHNYKWTKAYKDVLDGFMDGWISCAQIFSALLLAGRQRIIRMFGLVHCSCSVYGFGKSCWTLTCTQKQWDEIGWELWGAVDWRLGDYE